MTMKICVFGDSIAWGDWDARQGGWVERLKQFALSLEESTDYVYNFAIAGSKTDGMLRLLSSVVDEVEPQVVILAGGINDVQRIESVNAIDIETSVRNMRACIERAIRSARVVLVTPLSVDESRTDPVAWKQASWLNEDIDRYREAYVQLATELRVGVVDVSNVVSADQLIDGLHPNADGHEKIFNVVKEFLITNDVLTAK